MLERSNRLHCLPLPHGVDLLWGDKKCQNHSCRDQLCLRFAVNRRTSRGHEDTDTAETRRVSDCRYKVLSLPLSVKSIRGQCRWPLTMGGTLRHHGDRAAADNWAWDSVATKQHGLSNEINDVVLGLVSPRRGLSPNSPLLRWRKGQLLRHRFIRPIPYSGWARNDVSELGQGSFPQKKKQFT